MRIQDLMNKPAITCKTTDTLNTAARLMWEHDCGALPIEGRNGELVGMITDRDISMAAYTQGAPLHSISVERVMARQVFSCHAEESLQVAERLMRDKQVRRLPVVDRDNHILGVVSLNDIARHVVSAKNAVLDRELVDTLAAICEPRALPARPARAAASASATA